MERLAAAWVGTHAGRSTRTIGLDGVSAPYRHDSKDRARNQRVTVVNKTKKGRERENKEEGAGFRGGLHGVWLENQHVRPTRDREGHLWW